MSGKRYLEEFKLAAVCQVTEGGYSVSDLAKRPDVNVDSLYLWVKKFGTEAVTHQAKHAELIWLHKELKRVAEDRDLLKKAGILRKAVRVRYAFIKGHQDCWPTRWLFQNVLKQAEMIASQLN